MIGEWGDWASLIKLFWENSPRDLCVKGNSLWKRVIVGK